MINAYKSVLVIGIINVFSLWRNKSKYNVEVLICRMPGKAYARRKHIWLRGANEVDNKIFSRAISAKVHIFYSFTTTLCIYFYLFRYMQFYTSHSAN